MYNCLSLEEVFLKLSRKQGNENDAQDVNLTNNISLVSTGGPNLTFKIK